MNCWPPCFLLGAIILASGCGRPGVPPGPRDGSAGSDQTVFLSVTSDAKEDAQSVDMALKLAGFSLEEGRRVVVFFNVKGVTIPVKDFPEGHAFQDNRPLQDQLADLIERGVDVHVCPICMKALDVQATDLVEGAKVTTRPDLFAHIGPGTTVFTY